MKTAIVALLTVACVVLVPGAASPRDPGARIEGTPGGPDCTPGHEFVWLQGPEPEGLAYASQFAPDHPFYAECANDFIVTVDTEITHIHWWGVWFPPPRDGRPSLSVRRASWGAGGDRALDCTSAILSGCNIAVPGDNTGGPTNVDEYSCVGWLESGPEVVYELVVPFSPTTVTVTLSDLSADLDVFLLSACDENACITFGDNSFAVALDAGIYYLVVDGYYGAVSSYTLTVECVDLPLLYFAVRFYEHNVDLPSNLLYEQYLADGHESWNEELGCFEYWADIPPFPVVDGEHYWLSIQSVLNFTDFGQWYWWESEFSSLEWPVMDFELLGIPRWTSFPLAVGETVDLAFGLADIDTPVEARSWGVIKSLYR
jgi:hypothetical protein